MTIILPPFRALMPALLCAASITAGLAALSSPALAQSPQTSAPSTPQASPQSPPAPETLSPGEFNRMFEAYALLQAQTQLELTGEQYSEFIVRLRGLQNARRRHQQSRSRMLQDLRRLTNPQNANADEAVIRTTLEALAREDATAHEEITRATAQVDEILDVRQRARFRLLEEQLERRKLDLLSRVRRPGAANKAAAPRPKS